MIKLLNKQRSGWAVLAAGALVASVLAVGVVPAGAVIDRADHTTRLSACVGEAVADQMFADVSEGHVFRTAIDCIAYYEITKGTGDGTTYSPSQEVTRAQMAVFIARAAEAAGVELGEVSDAGFSDIGETWQEAQDAINRLASAGMIPSGGAFRPGDAITRAEMATFLIGLLSKATGKVTVGSGGRVLLTKGSITAEADDYFADAVAAVSDPATRSSISALYELGVTNGTGPTPLTDDDQPGLDLFYSPDGTVDRGQMAAFITRALSHTGLRPRGVSAQYDGAEVVVSVRDASRRPVAGVPVDVFWAPAAAANRVFTADRTCDHAIKADQSASLCQIDETDPATGSDGDVTVAVTGLRRIPEGGAAVWAWTGQLDGTVGRGTELYRLDIAEDADAGIATETLITTRFNASKAHFGSSVSYTLQLRDIVGNVTHGVDGVSPAQWTLSVELTGASGLQNPDARTLVSNNSGEAFFSLRVDDPDPTTVGQEVTATYTLSAADNAPPEFNTVHADGSPAATGSVIFSDAAPSIAATDAIVTVDTRRYVHVTGSTTGNTATVTVLDQYGNPFPGARVSLASTLDGVSPGGGTVNSRGSYRFAYRYSGEGGVTETLTPSYGATTASLTGTAVTVYWAADAGPHDDDSARAVLAGDVRRRHIVVNDGTGPVLLVYDDNDRFDLRGSPTSMAAFEAELATALRRDTPGVTLEWSNYRPGSDRRVTEYNLT